VSGFCRVLRRIVELELGNGEWIDRIVRMREVTDDRVLGLAVSWSRVWGRNCYGGWQRVGAGDGEGIVNWITGRRSVQGWGWNREGGSSSSTV
jgi:hypothetical protein